MNILVHGAGFVNKGDEAMLGTVRRQLGRRVTAEFYRLARDRTVRLAAAKGFHPIVRQRYSLPQRAWAKGVTTVLARLGIDARLGGRFGVKPRYPDLAKIDVVVDVSGFAVGDNWGSEVASTQERFARHMKRLGATLIFLPQAWGSFQDPAVARAAAAVLELSTLSFARDRQSLAYLEQLRPYPAHKVRCAADVAFLFEGDPPDVGLAHIQALIPQPRERPLIAVVPNMRVYERAEGSGEDNAYVRLLVATALHCVDTLGCNVIMVPHEIKIGGRNPDDRFLCELICRQANRPGRVAGMRGDYTAKELKSVIGHVDMLIGSRFHSLVAALSQKIPAVALGWSHKYAELMRDAGLDDYYVGITHVSEPDWLKLMDRAWAERKRNRGILDQKVPILQESAAQALAETASIIRGLAQRRGT